MLLKVSAVALLVSSLFAAPPRSQLEKLPKSFPVGAQIADGSRVEWIAYTNVANPFGAYLAMNLDFNQALPTLLALNASKAPQPLRNRGESHITVIAPTEFNRVLKEFVTIEEINQIALDRDIQNADINPYCLARQSNIEKNAASPIVGQRSYVYNILVESKVLTSIRVAVRDLFVKKGGDPANFSPKDWYPHITLAFNEHGDWFNEDYVFKTSSTCVSRLRFVDNNQKVLAETAAVADSAEGIL
ncbi:hypothetical protein HDU92_005471 [Lobulomyces angularis]|nr:hypothetical protein HDU92_005471 [Lobulomyces angularis]